MASNTDNEEDVIMCDCTGTKCSDIERMYFDGLNMDAISSKTGIMTGCGGCEWAIESYLEALDEERKK